MFPLGEGFVNPRLQEKAPMDPQFFDPAGDETTNTATGPFHVVLYQPEIPPNTGTIIRLCAATACPLHLIGPLGFRLDAPGLRRAGMDYRDLAHVFRWHNWEHYRTAHPDSGRCFAISTKGNRHYSQWHFRPGDHLLFGSESHGLPANLMEQHRPNLLRIPMVASCRSINLAMSVGIVLYEALRQNEFPNLDTAHCDGKRPLE